MSLTETKQNPVEPVRKVRDHGVFDAELYGTSFNLRILVRMMMWLKPYRVAVYSGLVLILFSATLAVLMPVIISLVVIDGILFKNTSTLMPDFGMKAATAWVEQMFNLEPLIAAGILFVALATCLAVLSHFARMSFFKAILLGLRDMRLDLFTHLEKLPASFYDKVAVGRVMTRVTNDMDVLLALLAGFGMLAAEFVPFFVALLIMFSVNVKLTFLMLIAMPVVGAVTYFFRQATRVVYRKIRSSISMLNQNLHENLSGIQVVQLNVRETQNLEQYTEINRENRKYENIAIELETVYGAFIDSMAAAALAVIVWFGGGEVVRNTMSLGSMVLFSQFVDMLFRPIVRLGEQYNVLFRAMASAERIFQALDWDEKIAEPENPVTLNKRLTGSIEFSNLTFGYEPDNPVLKNVSLKIKPGEKLAIVGPTGSGKSTMIRLLARFYDFEPGRIFLDGHDLNDIRSKDVRRRIGVVLQDFHVFSGSVIDNIILSNPDITRERAIQAARLVNAEDFILALPQGYDTPLIERGQNLSQGQRQLLAFARVLAADPEILVLDEATASIDTHTELKIQEALRTVTEGRTSILIAHRLQTIQEADRILVLKKGKVHEIGTHEELLAKDGLYATLYALQFQSNNGDN